MDPSQLPDETRYLQNNPWPRCLWDESDVPVLVVDGIKYRIRELKTRVEGKAAYIVGVTQKDFTQLCEKLNCSYVQFYWMRVTDLSPLCSITHLRHLAMRWNSKLDDLGPLQTLIGLQTLMLQDTPMACDLTPLAALRQLHRFVFDGAFGKGNTAISLAPLSNLPLLGKIELRNARVKQDGLRPLASCRNLRHLAVSNQFSTEDYAYLSVHLPQVQCNKFRAWVPVNLSNGLDRMVVGAKKKFFNSEKDKELLHRCEEKFSAMQKRFSEEMKTTTENNS